MKQILLAEDMYPESNMASHSNTLQSIHEVGEGFRPTDLELVNHFLKLKKLGRDHQVRRIPEINIYKFEPWELPQWYFFSLLVKKYKNSDRASRTTEFGYWKQTGRTRKIKAAITNEEIGTKKFLVFHVGRSPNGVRTPWKMHEYSATPNLPDQRDFVLCKLMKDEDGSANEDGPACFEEGEPSWCMSWCMNPDHQSEIPNQETGVNFMDFASKNQVAEADIPTILEEDLAILLSPQSFQESIDKHSSAPETPVSPEQDPFRTSDFPSFLADYDDDDDVFSGLPPL